ncbi:MAG: radical SAM family heme chaperone HemW [Bacteroidetes bacterium]|nr:radical SAM family heme chaperone HemW [Bacteroidota bacterium]
MAGIYIHIPYCKQACIYCDFHFSTTHKNKSVLLECLKQELILRKEELRHDCIDTIYFGGGTPSICSGDELSSLLETIAQNYLVQNTCEITLEANPDDLTLEKIKDLKRIGINRLSVGVQSFFEEDLNWMHRAHNAQQAHECLSNAQNEGILNLSVDLIFATPLLSDIKLEENLKLLMKHHLPHLSCYNLTIEDKTNLHHQIKTKKMNAVPDETGIRQFYLIRNHLQENGYEHYEISNYAKPGAYSKHNTSYWQRKKYMGIGPSAHSFTGAARSWNVRNNESYIRSLVKNELPSESETLSQNNLFNETLLTGLRTQWGVNLSNLKDEFHAQYRSAEPLVNRMILENQLLLSNDYLILPPPFLIMADNIASSLFII